MTTDAKIGLLLGLVFIVIIAFVINGLPSFSHKSPSIDSTKAYVVNIGNKPVGLPSAQPVEGDNNAISPQIAAATDKTTAEGQSPITQVNNVVTTQVPLQEAEVAVGPAKPQEALAPAETTDTQTEATAQAVPDKAQTTSAIYVVKKGDNLGLIAQNCYGTQGAKRENVTKIVKANHLKSEAQIYIGQKLVIPTTLAEAKPSMFEKVKSIGKSLANPSSEATKNATVTSKGLRDYVVKKDDYPWKIAAKELGNGTRYTEILKCNPGITEKTTLSVGMHLKLPAR